MILKVPDIKGMLNGHKGKRRTEEIKTTRRTRKAQNNGHSRPAPSDNGTNGEHRKEATLTRVTASRK